MLHISHHIPVSLLLLKSSYFFTSVFRFLVLSWFPPAVPFYSHSSRNVCVWHRSYSHLSNKQAKKPSPTWHCQTVLVATFGCPVPSCKNWLLVESFILEGHQALWGERKTNFHCDLPKESLSLMEH